MASVFGAGARVHGTFHKGGWPVLEGKRDGDKGFPRGFSKENDVDTLIRLIPYHRGKWRFSLGRNGLFRGEHQVKVLCTLG